MLICAVHTACHLQELNSVEEKRAIVFVNTKNQCDHVYNKLEPLGYRCEPVANKDGAKLFESWGHCRFRI